MFIAISGTPCALTLPFLSPLFLSPPGPLPPPGTIPPDIGKLAALNLLSLDSTKVSGELVGARTLHGGVCERGLFLERPKCHELSWRRA